MSEIFSDTGRLSKAWFLEQVRMCGSLGARYIDMQAMTDLWGRGKLQPYLDELLNAGYLQGTGKGGTDVVRYTLTSFGHRYLEEHKHELPDPLADDEPDEAPPFEPPPARRDIVLPAKRRGRPPKALTQDGPKPDVTPVPQVTTTPPPAEPIVIHANPAPLVQPPETPCMSLQAVTELIKEWNRQNPSWFIDPTPRLIDPELLR